MTEPSTIRLLVIDDELDHCRLIESCLVSQSSHRIQTTFAHTVEDGCATLHDDEYDCVLIDHNLPDGHGTDVLEEMEHVFLTVPVIAISTSRDPQVALAGFRGGAIDFITKHDAFTGDGLYRKILASITRFKRRSLAAVTRSRESAAGIELAQEAVLAAARMDPLLCILNRGAIDEIHADVHAQCSVENQPYAIFMADVDNFKRYNDTYGHGKGDQVLRGVADALRDTLRDGDFVARYGGEEFLVLAVDLDQDTCHAVASRFVRHIAELNLEHSGNDDFGRVTISLGAAVYAPGSGESPAEVIERADRALYRAKDGGRNQACTALPEHAATGA